MSASHAWASPTAALSVSCVFGVGVEGLALLDADGLELVDHDLVTGEPRLGLDDAVERFKIAHVPGDGGVVDHVDRIDELGRRRMSSLRERVELDPLAVGDGFGDVGLAAALVRIGAQQGVALVVVGLQGDVAGRAACPCSPGGRMRYLPPLPLSTPAGPTSSSAACQQSSMEPVIEPSPAEGISSTTGPTSFVLKKGIR